MGGPAGDIADYLGLEILDGVDPSDFLVAHRAGVTSLLAIEALDALETRFVNGWDSLLPLLPPVDLRPETTAPRAVGIECKKCKETRFRTAGVFLYGTDRLGKFHPYTPPSVFFDKSSQEDGSHMEVVFVTRKRDAENINDWVTTTGLPTRTSPDAPLVPERPDIFYRSEDDYHKVEVQACWDWARVRQAKSRGTLGAKYRYVCQGCGFNLSARPDTFLRFISAYASCANESTIYLQDLQRWIQVAKKA